MPVRTAGALVFLLLMIEQHNTFSFWNGYQINPKICQNILYSHCFMSQNTCFSFLNSGTAHHFLFLPKEQHTTFSFCQNHGWSILNQSFARFMMGSNYVDPKSLGKTVLDNVKKESMINRLSNLINRNRSAAKISQVLCSINQPIIKFPPEHQMSF